MYIVLGSPKIKWQDFLNWSGESAQPKNFTSGFNGSGCKIFALGRFTTPISKILLFLDFLGQYTMDSGKIFPAHHI